MKKKLIVKPNNKNELKIPPLLEKVGCLTQTYYKGIDGVGDRPFVMEYDEEDMQSRK